MFVVVFFVCLLFVLSIFVCCVSWLVSWLVCCLFVVFQHEDETANGASFQIDDDDEDVSE